MNDRHRNPADRKQAPGPKKHFKECREERSDVKSSFKICMSCLRLLVFVSSTEGVYSANDNKFLLSSSSKSNGPGEMMLK